MTRPLLILDLDETLVYAAEDHVFTAPHFTVGQHAVLKRPDVTEFLDHTARWFDLAVWTSSSGAYALPVVQKLFTNPTLLKFVWCYDRCTQRYDIENQLYFRAKDLRKVKRRGYPLERVVMIDDSPEKLARHYGNHIRIAEFAGDPSDTELRDLLPFLEWLKDQPNFRMVEKRDWRQRSAHLAKRA